MSDEILSGYEHKRFNSFTELSDAVAALSEEEKKKYIYECPDGFFVYGTKDVPDVDTDTGTGGSFGGSSSGSGGSSSSDVWFLRQVNQFGAIVRNEKVDDYIELKICPVGVTVEQMGEYYVEIDGSNHGSSLSKQWETAVQMPSLKNEKGDIPSRDYTKVAWAGIVGTQDVEEDTEAEDRIQVMFIGENLQYINKPGVTDASKKIPYPMGFTDYLDKAIELEDCGYTNVHESWSLSLSNCAAEHYLGQLHANNYNINTQAEIQVSFESDFIPDIRKVFLFNNKRYVCEKMELSVGEKGLDRLIKGYFFEIL